MVGVTVMVAVIGEPVTLVAVKEDMLPVPDAARPMAVLLLVHPNVAPAGLLLNAVPAIMPPLHTTIFEGTVTVDGTHKFAVQLPVAAVKQPTPVGVTVTATTSPGFIELTVNDNGILVPVVGGAIPFIV